MRVTVDEYNKTEYDNRVDLSNRFIRAFKAQCFENGGFPSRVNYEQELYRYIDSMHANQLERHYRDLCKGITLEEFELLKSCTEQILNMTIKEYKENFVVKSPMLASICESRIIDAATDGDKDKMVFEIGGGSGTLGAYLLNRGQRYAATDVTQAFYLIQNRIYDYILDGKLNENVLEERNDEARGIHIPYWKLWQDRYNPLNMDVVVSNHALLEMSQSSLRFYLNYCREALLSNKGAFVFQGGGWRINQNLIDLIQLFEEYGYHLQYFDHANEIVGFSMEGPSVSNDVLKALENLMSSDVNVTKIYALGDHLLSRLPKDQIYATGELGEKMKSKFARDAKETKLDINELLDYYDSLECESLAPDDEYQEYIKVKK